LEVKIVPKELSEFDKLEESSGRKGGKRVNWEDIARKIIEDNVFYSAREVWKLPHLVNKKVTLFRTKNALDELCRKTKKRPRPLLVRSYQENKFWYGRVLNRKEVMMNERNKK
jgi:hypothetical protein